MLRVPNRLEDSLALGIFRTDTSLDEGWFGRSVGNRRALMFRSTAARAASEG